MISCGTVEVGEVLVDGERSSFVAASGVLAGGVATALVPNMGERLELAYLVLPWLICLTEDSECLSGVVSAGNDQACLRLRRGGVRLLPGTSVSSRHGLCLLEGQEPHSLGWNNLLASWIPKKVFTGEQST